MHARAVAEHLRKRCLANLKPDAFPAGSKASADKYAAHESYIELTRVIATDDGVERGYKFTIRKMEYTKYAGMRAMWFGDVNVVTPTKEVYVDGNAPKHVIRCLESTYTDLRAKQRDDY